MSCDQGPFDETTGSTARIRVVEELYRLSDAMIAATRDPSGPRPAREVGKLDGGGADPLAGADLGWILDALDELAMHAEREGAPRLHDCLRAARLEAARILEERA